MVPLSFAPFEFAGDEWLLATNQAVFWPREQALLVADLHLEKASFFARHGQPIPPYDSRETLERVALAIRATGARRVITLGDNFHDADGSTRLEPHACGMLEALTKAVDWVWITGNHDDGHDPAMAARCGGTLVEELEIGGTVLRHQAMKGETRPELSGHFHPRVQIKVQQRHIRRPCAVVSSAETAGGAPSGRMILPAFGAFTGGMPANDPAILKAMQPAQRIDALVPTKERLARFPLWHEAA
ncbi:ligase-associated DNA damage response endonuclease PdeM [Qipengyuania spongiae]|uniref:Ligase-associated DNA damage response endonuclease PdeM n=1 Tax=Qipengyuania spongiae TaxID=2909673 RepID=A0ABY5T1I8_9SPHN|nr:ligase-associated DNA damage response endonuclease PdeM [Qipengyuania spongiae]UVI40627.1 ligase-associated DNA damage response endonuclease PdeM [Qipengyuania spongiae]